MNKSIRALALVAASVGVVACSHHDDAPVAKAAPKAKAECVKGAAEATATSEVEVVETVVGANYVNVSVSLPKAGDCGVEVYSIILTPAQSSDAAPHFMKDKDGKVNEDVMINPLGELNGAFLVTMFTTDSFDGATAFLFAKNKEGGLVLSEKIGSLSKSLSPYTIAKAIVSKSGKTGKSASEVIADKQWRSELVGPTGMPAVSGQPAPAPAAAAPAPAAAAATPAADGTQSRYN